MNSKRIFALVAGTMLLLAIPPSFMPYGYFEILRWVVATTGLYNAYQAYKSKQEEWMFLMVAIAILFNPFYSFHFSKDTWMVIDFMVAMFMWVFPIKPSESEK